MRDPFTKLEIIDRFLDGETSNSDMIAELITHQDMTLNKAIDFVERLNWSLLHH